MFTEDPGREGTGSWGCRKGEIDSALQRGILVHSQRSQNIQAIYLTY